MADRSRYYLAKVLAALGEPAEAIAELDAIVSKGPSAWNDRARLQKGQILLASERKAEAISEFEAIERGDPAGLAVPEARLRRAEALVAMDLGAEAEPLLSGLIEETSTAEPIASQAAYVLGGLQLDGARPDEALATFEKALGRPDLGTLAPLLSYRSAEALAALGRESEARGRFERVAAEHPDDDWADRALLAASRLALEAQSPQDQDSEAARALAAQLVARYPGSPLLPNALLIEARALRLQGRDAEAIPILADLIAADGTPADLVAASRYDLGLAYKATGQADRAAEVLAESAEAEGTATGPAASYALGQARFDAGRYDEAIAPLDRFLAERPADPLAPHALAYLAIASAELGKTTEVDESLARLQEGWPASEDLVRVRVRLGEAAYEAGDFERAAACSARRPRASRPSRPEPAPASAGRS